MSGNATRGDQHLYTGVLCGDAPLLQCLVKTAISCCTQHNARHCVRVIFLLLAYQGINNLAASSGMAKDDLDTGPFICGGQRKCRIANERRVIA